MPTRAYVIAALLFAACSARNAPPAASPTPLTAEAPPPTPPAPPQNTEIDSSDILARTATAPSVLVKHVLVGWKELAPAYGGHLDPRAETRAKADAARLAEKLQATLRADVSSIDSLIDKHSEDPGSLSHQPYEIMPESPYVPEFKALGLRLEVGEVGIVTTRFGYHVMLRVAPPPPDPLESADILGRPAGAGPVEVLDIVIGWAGLDPARDTIGQQRTKADADALAVELLTKIRAGADMPTLMKQYSEDPATSGSGRSYTIAADTKVFAPLKNLALRLSAGEAGLVKTPIGWHIVKRLPPPPPDPLESVAILQRTTIAPRVKVKHILLGWKDAHAEDPRGATRTRAQLEKLVKATVKKVSKKGASFEASMHELSEDPGSNKTGEAYEATPDTPMVPPFLNMSLRLQVDEIGVVRTEYGMHIIKRVE